MPTIGVAGSSDVDVVAVLAPVLSLIKTTVNPKKNETTRSTTEQISFHRGRTTKKSKK